MAENFIVSTAKAIILEPVSRKLIGYANALADASFTLAMESQDIRGGIGNVLKFNYKNTRTVNVTLTSVAYTQSFLPLNLGQEILNKPVRTAIDECLNLDANGAGELTNTPLGGVSYVTANQTTIYQPNLTHSKIVNLGLAYANQKVQAVYDYTATIDTIAIDASTPPSIVTLVMMMQIRDNETGKVKEWMQVEIPSFQPDGAYELSTTANGVAQEKLTGSALAVGGNSCSDGEIYGYVKFIPVDDGTGALSIAVADIAATPSPIGVPIGGTGQITVHGLRGGLASEVDITEHATYAIATGGDADITVDTEGLISVAAGATVSDSAVVEVSYISGSLTLQDTVYVTVVA